MGNAPPQSPIRACATADAVIISVMICCMIAAFTTFISDRPSRVAVYRQNAVVAEYPLSDDIAFTVGGKRGPLDIEIKNGIASIRHADCPRQICQKSSGISKTHEQLICAPNNILVEIRSAASDEEVDGVSY